MSEYILQCNNLTKKFGAKAALDNVSLSVGRGKIIGLLGPNGSGKTTMIKIANGLLTPTTGNLLIDDKQPGFETKKIVSYLPDKNYLSDWMTVRELVKMFEDFYEDFDASKAYTMIENLHISPEDKLKTLSKGNKEKVQLILVMSRSADLYLLDEPENSLSPQNQLQLKYFIEDSVRNFGCQFVISTHSPFLLSLRAARIYNIDETPPAERKWTELDCVKVYHDFFVEQSHKFH